MKKLVGVFVLFAVVAAKYHVYVKKLECNSSSKSIIDIKCFLKFYKRSNAIINMEINVIRALPDGTVNEKKF